MPAPTWIARHGRAAQGTAAGVRARAMQRPHGHHTQSITRGTNVKIGRWDRRGRAGKSGRATYRTVRIRIAANWRQTRSRTAARRGSCAWETFAAHVLGRLLMSWRIAIAALLLHDPGAGPRQRAVQQRAPRNPRLVQEREVPVYRETVLRHRRRSSHRLRHARRQILGADRRSVDDGAGRRRMSTIPATRPAMRWFGTPSSTATFISAVSSRAAARERGAARPLQ